MTWLRIDDGFPNHPKVAGLGPWAFRAYVSALCYSSRYLTDGFVPNRVIGGMTTANARLELVAAGLWETSSGGIRIHHYNDYNPTRDEVIENRSRVSSARRVSGRRGGLASQIAKQNGNQTVEQKAKQTWSNE